jgi:hypothetical protein
VFMFFLVVKYILVCVAINSGSELYKPIIFEKIIILVDLYNNCFIYLLHIIIYNILYDVCNFIIFVSVTREVA